MEKSNVIGYKALINHEEGECYRIYFPNLDYECYDNDDIDIIKSAEGFLSLHLFDLEDKGIEFPEASEINDFDKYQNDIVEIIEVDLEYDRMRTLCYNDDGSLKDPRQKPLADYYELCEKLDVEPSDLEIDRIISEIY